MTTQHLEKISMHNAGISDNSLDYVLQNQLLHYAPQSVVDFGAGAGKIGSIVRAVLGAKCKLIAVEGYGPTATALAAEGVYDKVETCLLQEWLEKNTNKYDLAVFGDVLEHLLPGEIHKMLRRALFSFRYIIIVVPLHNVFQGAAYGNELEIHKSYVARNFFNHYSIVEQHIFKGPRYEIMNVCLLGCSEEARRGKKSLGANVFHLMICILQPLGLAYPVVLLLKKASPRWKRILFKR